MSGRLCPAFAAPAPRRITGEGAESLPDAKTVASGRLRQAVASPAGRRFIATAGATKGRGGRGGGRRRAEKVEAVARPTEAACGRGRRAFADTTAIFSLQGAVWQGGGAGYGVSHALSAASGFPRRPFRFSLTGRSSFSPADFRPKPNLAATRRATRPTTAACTRRKSPASAPSARLSRRAGRPPAPSASAHTASAARNAKDRTSASALKGGMKWSGGTSW